MATSPGLHHKTPWPLRSPKHVKSPLKAALRSQRHVKSPLKAALRSPKHVKSPLKAAALSVVSVDKPPDNGIETIIKMCMCFTKRRLVDIL